MDSPEQWKDIPGYEGYYQVSDQGRVKALARYVPERTHGRWQPLPGQVFTKFWRERIMKTKPGANGYLRAMLRRNGKSATVLVHRLVLLAFVGEPEPRQQACHNDGNRANNHLTNLRWDSSKNNHADKKRHGTQPFGENHHNAKLTDTQVLAILSDPRGPAEIARGYGVTTSCISQIQRRVSRKEG